MALSLEILEFGEDSSPGLRLPPNTYNLSPEQAEILTNSACAYHLTPTTCHLTPAKAIGVVSANSHP